MKLAVDRLKDTPQHFRFEADASWWQSACALISELDRRAPESLDFDLRAHRMGADLYLEGRVEGALELTCGRCANRYRQPLGEHFRLVLEPAGDRVPSEPEGASVLERDGVWLGDEIEAGWFRGSVIDLGAFFREVVALTLPVQPLCREDCRGLCPQCGVDRNRESCDCPDPRTHAPFAALAALGRNPAKGRD